MRALIRRIHLYLGLLNFTALIVFGIAGLTAALQPRPVDRHHESEVRTVSFSVEPGATDRQVADSVFETLRIPLSRPIPDFALHRNGENQLALDFYTLNGVERVTVLEEQHQLRIEKVQHGLWTFLNEMHAVTVGGQSPYLTVRMWSWYNEFAIWCLIAMALSGVYLWLASRPGFRWAQYSFGAGCGAFVLLYVLTR